MRAGLTPADVEALQRLMALRAELFEAIRRELEEDDYHKPYEGQFAIVWPNYFEQQERPVYRVHLDCYLIGPGRYHTWEGATLAEAVAKAEQDVRQWIREAEGVPQP